MFFQWGWWLNLFLFAHTAIRGCDDYFLTNYSSSKWFHPSFQYGLIGHHTKDSTQAHIQVVRKNGRRDDDLEGIGLDHKWWFQMVIAKNEIQIFFVLHVISSTPFHWAALAPWAINRITGIQVWVCVAVFVGLIFALTSLWCSWNRSQTSMWPRFEHDEYQMGVSWKNGGF